MRQAIHIFAKDVRALWPQILLVLALTAAAPAIDRDLLAWALFVARWYLIVCVVHQEKLTGDRQWWVTRPYSWKSLLASKVMMFVTFVCLPSLIADIVTLKVNGLPLGPAWGNIWTRQAIMAPLWYYGLPAMALAAATTGMVSFALAGLAAVAGLTSAAALLDLVMRWGYLIWIPLALVMIVMAAVPAAVLVWQYSSRRTLAARAALCGAFVACVVVVVLPPSGWAVGIQTHLWHAPADVEGIHLEFGNELSVEGKGRVDLKVPLNGLPADMRAQPDLFHVEFVAQDRWKWNSGWRQAYNSWTWLEASGARVSIEMPRAALERVRSRDVEMRLSVAMTVLGPERTEWVSLQHGDVTVAGVGICTLKDQMVRVMECRNGVPPEADISVPISGHNRTRSLEWPFRVSFGLSPLWRDTVPLPAYWNGDVAFRLRQPIAHLRRDLVIGKIRLAGSE